MLSNNLSFLKFNVGSNTNYNLDYFLQTRCKDTILGSGILNLSPKKDNLNRILFYEYSASGVSFIDHSLEKDLTTNYLYFDTKGHKLLTLFAETTSFDELSGRFNVSINLAFIDGSLVNIQFHNILKEKSIFEINEPHFIDYLIASFGNDIKSKHFVLKTFPCSLEITNKFNVTYGKFVNFDTILWGSASGDIYSQKFGSKPELYKIISSAQNSISKFFGMNLQNELTFQSLESLKLPNESLFIGLLNDGSVRFINQENKFQFSNQNLRVEGRNIKECFIRTFVLNDLITIAICYRDFSNEMTKNTAKVEIFTIPSEDLLNESFENWTLFVNERIDLCEQAFQKFDCAYLEKNNFQIGKLSSFEITISEANKFVLHLVSSLTYKDALKKIDLDFSNILEFQNSQLSSSSLSSIDFVSSNLPEIILKKANVTPQTQLQTLLDIQSRFLQYVLDSAFCPRSIIEFASKVNVDCKQTSFYLTPREFYGEILLKGLDEIYQNINSQSWQSYGNLFQITMTEAIQLYDEIYYKNLLKNVSFNLNVFELNDELVNFKGSTPQNLSLQIIQNDSFSNIFDFFHNDVIDLIKTIINTIQPMIYNPSIEINHILKLIKSEFSKFKNILGKNSLQNNHLLSFIMESPYVLLGDFNFLGKLNSTNLFKEVLANIYIQNFQTNSLLLGISAYYFYHFSCEKSDRGISEYMFYNSNFDKMLLRFLFLNFLSSSSQKYINVPVNEIYSQDMIASKPVLTNSFNKAILVYLQLDSVTNILPEFFDRKFLYSYFSTLLQSNQSVFYISIISKLLNVASNLLQDFNWTQNSSINLKFQFLNSFSNQDRIRVNQENPFLDQIIDVLLTLFLTSNPSDASKLFSNQILEVSSKVTIDKLKPLFLNVVSNESKTLPQQINSRTLETLLSFSSQTDISPKILQDILKNIYVGLNELEKNFFIDILQNLTELGFFSSLNPFLSNLEIKRLFIQDLLIKNLESPEKFDIVLAYSFFNKKPYYLEDLRKLKIPNANKFLRYSCAEYLYHSLYNPLFVSPHNDLVKLFIPSNVVPPSSIVSFSNKKYLTILNPYVLFCQENGLVKAVDDKKLEYLRQLFLIADGIGLPLKDEILSETNFLVDYFTPNEVLSWFLTRRKRSSPLDYYLESSKLEEALYFLDCSKDPRKVELNHSTQVLDTILNLDESEKSKKLVLDYFKRKI